MVAVTTTRPPRGRVRAKEQRGASPGPGHSSGDGVAWTNGRGRGPGGGDGGSGGFDEIRRDRAATMAVWMLLAAVTLMFMAFTSTYVVRSAEPGWVQVPLPRIVWFNTALLLFSSATMEASRRRARLGDVTGARRALVWTLALGVAFVLGQVWAWIQWRAAGVAIAASTHAAFFYLLSGTHGAHVLGGLAALVYGVRRLAAGPGTASADLAATVGRIAVYWHFVDGLWIYVLALLLW